MNFINEIEYESHADDTSTIEAFDLQTPTPLILKENEETHQNEEKKENCMGIIECKGHVDTEDVIKSYWDNNEDSYKDLKTHARRIQNICLKELRTPDDKQTRLDIL